LITNKKLIIKRLELPGGQLLAGINWVITVALLELLLLTATKNKIYHILLKPPLDRKNAIIQG
jgi:hypothetical protein